MNRVCSSDGCAVVIGVRNQSGYCKACCVHVNFHSPASSAKRKVNATAAVKTPEHRAKAKRNAIRMHADRKDDPVWQERLRKQGAALRLHDNYEDSWRAGRQRKVEQDMAWCPPERRDDYMLFRRKVGAKQAKAIVLAEMVEAERKRRASLSFTEHAQEAFQRGARLTPTFRPRKAEPAFSITGGSL